MRTVARREFRGWDDLLEKYAAAETAMNFKSFALEELGLTSLGVDAFVQRALHASDGSVPDAHPLRRVVKRITARSLEGPGYVR